MPSVGGSVCSAQGGCWPATPWQTRLPPAPTLKEDISKKQAHGWGNSMEGGLAKLCHLGPGPAYRVSGLVPGVSEPAAGTPFPTQAAPGPALPQCSLSLPGHGVCL